MSGASQSTSATSRLSSVSDISWSSSQSHSCPSSLVEKLLASSNTPKMMVVDDVLSNRKMLYRLLKAYGVDACMAVDGQDALDQITPNFDEFKVIFMDNLMPIMVSVKMGLE